MSEIEHLRNQIMRSGYPLEIKTSSMLDKGWTNVINTDSYFDRDEGKLRDVDIVANRFAPDSLAPLSLETVLVIECKKDTTFAWVFFTRPFDFSVEEIDGQYIDELQISCRSSRPTQLRDLFLDKTKLHYEEFERVAVSYDAFPLKPKKSEYDQKKREIFEAQNQLKKYICYLNEQTMKQPSRKLITCDFHFPCIVFQGEMYEAHFIEEKMELVPKKHILMTTQYRPSYSIWEQCYLIDVVQAAYFRRYLRKIHKDIKNLEDIITRKRKKLIKTFEEVQSLIRSE